MTSSALQRTRPMPSGRLRLSERPAPLRVVSEQSDTRSALPVVLAIVITALVILSVHLYVNTQLAQLSYDIRQTQTELSELTDDSQVIEQQIQQLSAPENVRRAALQNGMVPVGATGLINLSAGTVDGGTPAR